MSQWPMIVSVVECDWLMYDKRQGGQSDERQWRLWGPVHWSVRPTHKSSSRVAAYPIVGNGAPKFGDSKTTSNNTHHTNNSNKKRQRRPLKRPPRRSIWGDKIRGRPERILYEANWTPTASHCDPKMLLHNIRSIGHFSTQPQPQLCTVVRTQSINLICSDKTQFHWMFFSINMKQILTS